MKKNSEEKEIMSRKITKLEKDLSTIELFYQEKWNNDFESVTSNL